MGCDTFILKNISASCTGVNNINFKNGPKILLKILKIAILVTSLRLRHTYFCQKSSKCHIFAKCMCDNTFNIPISLKLM